MNGNNFINTSDRTYGPTDIKLGTYYGPNSIWVGGQDICINSDPISFESFYPIKCSDNSISISNNRTVVKVSDSKKEFIPSINRRKINFSFLKR